MTLAFAPISPPRRFSRAEFTANLEAGAHSLIPEIKHRLDPEKYRQFCIILPDIASLSSENKLPENTPMMVEQMLDGQMDLIEKFNAFLPEEKYRVAIKPKPSPSLPESIPEAYKDAIEFMNQIWRHDKKLLRSVLEVLNSYSRKEIGESSVVAQMVELLKGNPQLLQEFGKFLPVACATPITAKTQEGEIGDLEEEEERKRKRAKTGEEKKKKKKKKKDNNNNYNTCQKEILKSIHKNRETATFSSPSLYTYSKTLKLNPANPLPKELRTLLKPRDEEQPAKKKRRSEESTEEAFPERPTPSYKLLSPPKNKPEGNGPEPVLNTTVESSAPDYNPERKWKWDPEVERMNNKEEDLYRADMAKSMLESAAEYAGARGEIELRQIRKKRWAEEMHGKKFTREEELKKAMEEAEFPEEEELTMEETAGLGRIYVKRCVEGMYGEEWTEEEIEMALNHPKFVRVVVKKRLIQKQTELKSSRGASAESALLLFTNYKSS